MIMEFTSPLKEIEKPLEIVRDPEDWILLDQTRILNELNLPPPIPRVQTLKLSDFDYCSIFRQFEVDLVVSYIIEWEIQDIIKVSVLNFIIRRLIDIRDFHIKLYPNFVKDVGCSLASISTRFVEYFKTSVTSNLEFIDGVTTSLSSCVENCLVKIVKCFLNDGNWWIHLSSISFNGISISNRLDIFNNLNAIGLQQLFVNRNDISIHVIEFIGFLVLGDSKEIIEPGAGIPHMNPPHESKSDLGLAIKVLKCLIYYMASCDEDEKVLEISKITISRLCQLYPRLVSWVLGYIRVLINSKNALIFERLVKVLPFDFWNPAEIDIELALGMRIF